MRRLLLVLMLLAVPALAFAGGVITPGQEDVIADMLGRGGKPGGCAFKSASIEKTYIVGTYECAGKEVELELRALDDAESDVKTTKFAIVGSDAPLLLRKDVRESVAAHEGSFHWSTPTSASTSAPAGTGSTGNVAGPSPSAPSGGPSLGETTRAPWLAALWLVPVLGVFAAIRRIRIPRNVVVVAGLLTVLAAVVRFCLPATPANYFTDVLGPFDAVSSPFVPRGAGIHGLYRLIARAVPLSSSAVFAIQRLLGSFSVGLVVLAMSVAPRKLGHPGAQLAVAGVAGLLLALDPMQAWLSSSDAMHVPALFAFAVGALVYSTSCIDDTPKRWRLPLLFVCAALPGLARVELALAPLAYPFVLGRWRGRNVQHAVLVAAVATAALVALQTSFNSSVQGASLERVRAWASVLRSTIDSGSEAWISPGLAQIAVLGAVVGLCRRRPGVAMALMVLIALHAVRIMSPLAGAGAWGALAYARHDILHEVILCMITAWAMHELVEAVRTRWPNRLASIGSIAVLALWTVSQRASFRRDVYTFQAEYRFLAKELKRVDSSCRVVSVWHKGVPGVAFESALALPHPVLAYDAPRRPWIIVTDRSELAAIGPGCSVYFESSFCQLAANATFADDFPQTREVVAATKSACDALASASTGTLAEQQVEARPLLWPYRSATVRLALHPLNLPSVASSVSPEPSTP